MKKKVLIPLIMFLSGLVLISCSNEESLTEEWQNFAAESGFSLDSVNGEHRLIFYSDGMEVVYGHIIENDLEQPFPFEEDTLYTDYEVLRNGDILTIKTEDDLQYELTVRGDRLFTDEENGIDYSSDSCLLGTEQDNSN